ncbi:hypothetical protein UA08_03193 [Talaromyces atroroseus]|uniref:Uncharacterized protein n=1 Tax=Talaromyces atroroseus TaxID=1441469 RepID=A0A225AP67_TALAT|nr:hypothetical protein UA08_03193 [Talaromyces atroroseus]OKL61263.1 hypothetical protein UA08_03193 [Talaromyces atroroseus]
MKVAVTSNIPRFLLPRGIPSHTLRYARRNFSSSSARRAAEDKPRTLAQPDKFRPPSHPARRVLQTRNGKVVSQNVRDPFNYPGRPLSAKEKEERKTKRYPNMFPAEGTVLFKFLTTRWIHVWISMGVLTSLATFTFTENFKRTSAFAHLLPPWSGLLTNPISTISQAISVWKMHVQHTSMIARENRHKRIEDAEKRRQYRIAHGLEEPEKAASPVVEDDQSPIAAPVAAGEETEKRVVKKWFGIW